MLGDAIFNDARAVRAIIRQVESQRLAQARGSQTGVGEERLYTVSGGAERVRLPVVDSASRSVWPPPAYQNGGPKQGASKGRE